jgi:hypothetical protein
MRKIVLLSAASIMFAATVPVSAQQVISKTCAAVATRAINEADNVCGKDSVGSFIFGMAFGGMSFGDAKQTLIKALNDPAEPTASKACLYALLRALEACDVPRYGGKAVLRYKTPHAPVTPRDPKQMPPAGLLETTPGLTPQGPAAGGTPSRPSLPTNAVH